MCQDGLQNKWDLLTKKLEKTTSTLQKNVFARYLKDTVWEGRTNKEVKDFFRTKLN